MDQFTIPPTIWRYALAETSQGRCVVVSVTTPYGESQYLLDTEAAFEIAKQVRSMAMKSQQKLEVVESKIETLNGNGHLH